MAPRFATFPRQRIHAIILGVVVLVIVGPTLYYRTPFIPLSPDILYVKAKVMWVLRGDIFTDPITGLVTMHPPFYHLFLSPFVAAGLGINLVMSVTSALVVALIFFLTFKIVSRQFDRNTAFWTCLMLPFIYQFMGPRNILLSTSYNFSIPFYLAGLWLYLDSTASIRKAILTGVLWGLAFLISPVYLFLIGLTFLYEWGIKKRFKRFLMLAGTFMVMMIPFLIQLYVVYSRGLGDAETFSLWRGIPGADWFKNFAVEFIAPTYHDIVSFSGLAHIALLLATLILIVRARTVNWYILLAFLAYVLTYYHFSAQYAIRIQLFFSIFLVAWLFRRLRRHRIPGFAFSIVAVLLMTFAVYRILDETVSGYRLDMGNMAIQKRLGRRIEAILPRYAKEDSYILCELLTYRLFVMPFCPVHTLGAYRTMEYFQLPQDVADKLDSDYQLIENSDDYALIDSIAREYHITTAIEYVAKPDVPFLKTLEKYWQPVFHGPYFTILQRPESDSAEAKPATDDGPG